MRKPRGAQGTWAPRNFRYIKPEAEEVRKDRQEGSPRYLGASRFLPKNEECGVVVEPLAPPRSSSCQKF